MPEEEDLLLDKLASGDRPSVYAAGIVAAKALKECGVAVLISDVLGRVHLMPPQAVELKFRPRLTDEELNLLEEDAALVLLARQGDEEETILAYLKRRHAAEVRQASLGEGA